MITREKRSSTKVMHGIVGKTPTMPCILQFCRYNNPVITAKVFTHKMGHKLTWPSHDGEMANLIDCVIVNRILAQMMPFVYL